MKLDRKERDILQVLQTQGRISNVELAERVGLSESPCFRRVKRLEESGLIQGYAARLDQRQLGLQVTGIAQVVVVRAPQRNSVRRDTQPEKVKVLVCTIIKRGQRPG